MQNETSRISCQKPNCPKNSIGVIEKNGEKFLLMTFRHNNEQHQQKLSLKELVKENLTFEDWEKIFKDR